MSVSNLLVPNNTYLYAGTLDTSGGTTNGGIILPNITPSPFSNELSYYRELTYTITSLTGPFASPAPSLLLHFTRIGNVVTVTSLTPVSSGTFSGSANFISLAGVPSIFVPTVSVNFPLMVVNNGVILAGTAILGTDGSLKFFQGLLPAGQTVLSGNLFNMGTIGIYQFTVSYIVT